MKQLRRNDVVGSSCKYLYATFNVIFSEEFCCLFYAYLQVRFLFKEIKSFWFGNIKIFSNDIHIFNLEQCCFDFCILQDVDLSIDELIDDLDLDFVPYSL